MNIYFYSYLPQFQPSRAEAKINIDIDGSGPLRPFQVDCRFRTDQLVSLFSVYYINTLVVISVVVVLVV